MAHSMVSTATIDSKIQTVIRHPDVEEDLAFFSFIDAPTRIWLDALIHRWELWKKCNGISDTLINYFSTAPNPYLSTLRIVVNTLKGKQPKNAQITSLAITVLEEFSKWLESRKHMYKDCLTVEMKIAAFKLLTKHTNRQLISMVSAAYDFVEHKQVFLDIVENMISEKKYKEAAIYITILELQEHFLNPETVLLPLILQNRLSIVEEFLAESPEMQKNLIMYLDQLVVSETILQNALVQFIEENEVPLVKKWGTKVHRISKLIARLVKLFNLPQDYCPNLNNRQSRGALNFLIHKRYVDGSLGIESWRELLLDAVGDNTKLQVDVIKMLVRVNDCKEGLYWAKRFNIPEEQWPWAITAENNLAEMYGDASTSKEENWDGEDNIENFHKFHLPKDCIKVIDNPRSFEYFLERGLTDVTRVGLDCEWKPCFGGPHSTQLALIQVATASNVYILDVATIGDKLGQFWDKLRLQLFDNNKILKLGYGISHDMTVIRNCLPALSKIQTHGEGYLDIEQLWKKLVQDYKFVFPHESEDFQNKGLSKLVELCLGHGLNKSDQCSNWIQRPLRESQLIYAALDAYCLLEVYDVLESQSDQLDIPFQDICAEIQHIPHKTVKKSKSPKKCKSPSKNGPSKNSGTLKNTQEVVVDNPAHGLDSSFLSSVDEEDNDSSDKKNCQTTPRIHDNCDFQRDDYSGNRESQTGRPNLGFLMQSSPIPVHKWRVVCDSMLGGLTSKLRLCGCDCVYVMYDEGGDQSARLAMDENRVLLTRNKRYLRFMQYLQPDKCYRVMSNTPDDQLREVLEYFGVLVTQRDILSRCRRCNYDEFVQVPNALMREIVKSFFRVTHRTLHSQFERELETCTYQSNSPTGSNNCDIGFNDCANDRTWRLSTNSINLATCTTKYQVRVQIDKVPLNVLKNVQLFYICERCGKVYWDGSHLKHTLNGIIRDLIVPA